MKLKGTQELAKPRNLESRFREQLDMDPAISGIIESLHLSISAKDVPAFFAHIREVHAAMKADRVAINEVLDAIFVAYCEMTQLLSVALEGCMKESGKDCEMLALHGTADDREPRSCASSQKVETHRL
ncbi:hypothetical protein DL98DRAFT_522804 [Cadophora sp. DSE1049]|nr:hypothetical protein DL98DRAFT_522804 [Cadophora sp. DSE1049]